MTWVIRQESPIPKTGSIGVSWWYGPKHGWGRTFGSSHEAHKFATRKEAETAIRHEFGSDIAWTPQRLDEALTEFDARSAAYEARVGGRK